MKHYLVGVNTPFNNSLLTYKFSSDLEVGTIVNITLGKRKTKGCVLQELQEETIGDFDVRLIDSICERSQKFSKNHLNFLNWASDYYHYPIGQHIFDVMPKEMKREAKLPGEWGENSSLEYELTAEQVFAIDKINTIRNFEKFLLHGVTGSGKTSVYIETLKECFKRKKNALLLVPEINLTPALLNILKRYLPYKIYSYHSAVTNSHRFGLWHKLNDEEDNYLIVGVRSSIFLPYENLGLVIVDEEHDSSYKQNDRMCYHARDLAIKKAQLSKCPIILASATPSLETFSSVSNKESNYLTLKNRPGHYHLPEIILRDKKSENSDYENPTWPFSQDSINELQDVVEKGEQAIVFINRLGFANYIQCHGCGHTFECLNCSVSLKYYKSKMRLECPTCDYKVPMPQACPNCGNLKLIQKGYGTEKLEEVIKEHIQGAIIERFDRDKVSTFKKLNDALERFNAKKSNIMIGTQMLSKGHNFKDVNYVLVLGIDSQLNFPDFRSSENTYQLLSQISGRSGRYSNYGKVVVETYDPENGIFKRVKENSFSDFYKEEVKIRNSINLPPFSKLSALYVTGRFQNKVMEYTLELEKLGKNIALKHFESIDLLGARPTFVEKRANKYTWLILVRSKSTSDLHNFIHSLKSNLKTQNGISFKVDIDPQTIL